MDRLKDKVALITGAASGIGRATAELFAKEGATVVLTDRNLDGEKVAAAIDSTVSGGGERAIFQALDVTRESAWVSVVDETVKRFGRLDVLVNNAGVGVVKSVEDTTLAEWRFVQSVNSDGVFLGCKHAMRVMKARGGSIINLSSVAGLIGAANLAAYCASKGAVRLLTKSVALHGAKHRVRCNSVHPSFIATPMVEAMAEASNDGGRMRQAMEHAAPLGGGGFGEAIDVALMILYLASDESKFVTGAEMVIDGGTTAR